MNNYIDKSDLEINCMVADAKGLHSNVDGGACWVFDEGTDGTWSVEFDPCNNPADSWKLMAEMVKMGFQVLVQKSGHVGVFKHEDGTEYHPKCEEGIQKSMAICFLMIKGGEV